VLSPADVVAAAEDAWLEAGADSVVRDTAVVEASDTMMAAVEEGTAEVVSGEAAAVVSLLPLFCLFLNSAFTATSCFAISTSREARTGFSL